MKMLGEGRIKDISLLEQPLDLCLGCRACETACPTGVEYGSILESARAAIVRHKKYSFLVRQGRKLIFKRLLPSRFAMNSIGNLLWIYEKSGLQAIMRKTGLLKLFPHPLSEFEAVAPPAISPWKRMKLPALIPAKGKKKFTVAFFTGCVMDAMFRRINELSIRLLAEVGCDVRIIDQQTCCGALHAHAGEAEQAKMLAKTNISAFDSNEVDFIVNNSGGCGAAMVEYEHLFKDDPKWAELAKQFSDKSKDISQVLSYCGGLNGGLPQAECVTYQRSCHMTHVQKVTREPVELIQSLSNVEYVEMQDREKCCGSAGSYNLINYHESMKVLDIKMKHAKHTKAMTIVTTNPGCLLQMKLGIERERMSGTMRAVHLVELLSEAQNL